MRFFPSSTLQQLEFDKIKAMVSGHCRMDYAKEMALNLRIHTKKEFIDKALGQTNECKIINGSGQSLPNDFTVSIAKELKLIGIPGASLTGEQFLLIRR